MTWTRFMDMHSGGGLKESPYEYIYIEAPEDEAKAIFYNRFGHNPERVSCTCCGDDYSIGEHETLQRATAYERGCAHVYFYSDDASRVEDDPQWRELVWDQKNRTHTYKGRAVDGRYVEEPDLHLMAYGADREECEGRYKTLGDYLGQDDVLVIPADDIKPEEREGSVPSQGYVWMD